MQAKHNVFHFCCHRSKKPVAGSDAALTIKTLLDRLPIANMAVFVVAAAPHLFHLNARLQFCTVLVR
jgi:hypothetical protein